MCKFNPKNGSRRIDPCMENLIKNLNKMKKEDFNIVACCCGHRKYPMTIIVRDLFGCYFDIISGIFIPRKKRFYKKDKQGYYFIPEVIEE